MKSPRPRGSAHLASNSPPPQELVGTSPDFIQMGSIGTNLNFQILNIGQQAQKISPPPQQIMSQNNLVPQGKSLLNDNNDMKILLKVYTERENVIKQLRFLRRESQVKAENNEVYSFEEIIEALGYSSKGEKNRFEYEELVLKKYFNVRTDILSLKNTVLEFVNYVLKINQKTYQEMIDREWQQDALEILRQTNRFREEVGTYLFQINFRLTSTLLFVCSFSRQRFQLEYDRLYNFMQKAHPSLLNQPKSSRNNGNQNIFTLSSNQQNNNSNNNYSSNNISNKEINKNKSQNTIQQQGEQNKRANTLQDEEKTNACYNTNRQQDNSKKVRVSSAISYKQKKASEEDQNQKQMTKQIINKQLLQRSLSSQGDQIISQQVQQQQSKQQQAEEQQQQMKQSTKKGSKKKRPFSSIKKKISGIGDPKIRSNSQNKQADQVEVPENKIQKTQQNNINLSQKQINFNPINSPTNQDKKLFQPQSTPQKYLSQSQYPPAKEILQNQKEATFSNFRDSLNKEANNPSIVQKEQVSYWSQLNAQMLKCQDPKKYLRIVGKYYKNHRNQLKTSGKNIMKKQSQQQNEQAGSEVEETFQHLQAHVDLLQSTVDLQDVKAAVERVLVNLVRANQGIKQTIDRYFNAVKEREEKDEMPYPFIEATSLLNSAVENKNAQPEIQNSLSEKKTATVQDIANSQLKKKQSFLLPFTKQKVCPDPLSPRFNLCASKTPLTQKSSRALCLSEFQEFLTKSKKTAELENNNRNLQGDNNLSNAQKQEGLKARLSPRENQIVTPSKITQILVSRAQNRPKSRTDIPSIFEELDQYLHISTHNTNNQTLQLGNSTLNLPTNNTQMINSTLLNNTNNNLYVNNSGNNLFPVTTNLLNLDVNHLQWNIPSSNNYALNSQSSNKNLNQKSSSQYFSRKIPSTGQSKAPMLSTFQNNRNPFPSSLQKAYASTLLQSPTNMNPEIRINSQALNTFGKNSLDNLKKEKSKEETSKINEMSHSNHLNQKSFGSSQIINNDFKIKIGDLSFQPSVMQDILKNNGGGMSKYTRKQSAGENGFSERNNSDKNIELFSVMTQGFLKDFLSPSIIQAGNKEIAKRQECLASFKFKSKSKHETEIDRSASNAKNIEVNIKDNNYNKYFPLKTTLFI